MTQPTTGDKIPVTLHLSADVAARLKMAAEAQKRPAADLAAELLDRHLPRPQTGGPKGGAFRILDTADRLGSMNERFPRSPI